MGWVHFLICLKKSWLFSCPGGGHPRGLLSSLKTSERGKRPWTSAQSFADNNEIIYILRWARSLNLGDVLKFSKFFTNINRFLTTFSLPELPYSCEPFRSPALLEAERCPVLALS